MSYEERGARSTLLVLAPSRGQVLKYHHPLHSKMIPYPCSILPLLLEGKTFSITAMCTECILILGAENNLLMTFLCTRVP